MSEIVKPMEEDVPHVQGRALVETFEQDRARSEGRPGWGIAQAVNRAAQIHGLKRQAAWRLLRDAGALPERPAANVFQMNGGEWFIGIECEECHVAVHLPCGEERPGADAVKVARAAVRFCDECNGRAAAAHEVAEERRVLDALILGSGMPAALRGMAFAEMQRDGGRRDTAILACEKWAAGELEKPGIYLFGAPGVGKTRLSATTAWARIQGRRPIRWCSVVTLMQNLNRVFSDRERAKALSILTGTDALVLDDLDKVNPSEFGKQQVFTAINERVQAGTPLLVTANARLSEIGERYGDHVMSRLAGHCMVFELDGDDRRLTLDVDGKGTQL